MSDDVSAHYIEEVRRQFHGHKRLGEGAIAQLTDDQLFATQWVKVSLSPEEFPGYKGERVVCDHCGEGINFRREVRRQGKVLCRGCAGENYYEPA